VDPTRIESERAPAAASKQTTPVVAGVYFGVAGALATLPFVLLADNPADSARMITVAAAIAASLVGALMWLLVVGDRSERWRGPVAGALTGLLAHPPMWAIVSVVLGAGFDFGIEKNVSGAFGSAVFFGFFSMVIYGALTAPIGAFVGWWLGRVRGR
jgi:hypothetical protein